MTRTSQDSIRLVTDLACVVAFAFVLCVPLVGFVLGRDSVVSTGESGRISEQSLPEATPLRTFAERFERYFDSHLGFRDQLVRWNTAITILWFHTDPPTRIYNEARPARLTARGRVALGREGYLFYITGLSEKSLRGLDPMGSAELRRWRDLFERRQAALAVRGIRYLLVFIPEKYSAVPDYLPAALARRVGPSRSDQLVEELTDESTIDVLDLRQWLRDVPTDYPTYHRTGTHWNELGAFLAYRQLILHLKKVYPVLEPRRLEQFDMKYRLGPGRGLTYALGIPGMMDDEYVDMTPLVPRIARETGPNAGGKYLGGTRQRGNWSGEFVSWTTGRKDLPKAAFVHDSFVATYMEPFLSEQFEAVTYFWSRQIPMRAIQAQKPDIVIEVRVERLFDTFTPAFGGTLRRRNAK